MTWTEDWGVDGFFFSNPPFIIFYWDCEDTFSYLKFTEQMEIDLIVERPGRSTILIEIKSAINVMEEDLKALIHYRKDFGDVETLCISQDTLMKEVNGVLCLPWREGINRILHE